MLEPIEEIENKEIRKSLEDLVRSGIATLIILSPNGWGLLIVSICILLAVVMKLLKTDSYGGNTVV